MTRCVFACLATERVQRRCLLSYARLYWGGEEEEVFGLQQTRGSSSSSSSLLSSARM